MYGTEILKEISEEVRHKMEECPLGRQKYEIKEDIDEEFYERPIVSEEFLYGKDGCIKKENICRETGWSRETVDMIRSKEESAIYMDAGLKEEEIAGKKCLVRMDLDMEQKDEFGRSNKERMENGMAPLSKDGEIIELHHIGQKQDSPLAELTTSEHRKGGNDTILHDKMKESEIDRVEFTRERKEHWENRAGFS